MKKKLLSLLPYILVLAADFFLLPCLMTDTGAAMLMMLCVMPLLAFLTAVACGVRTGFGLLLPLAAMALFAPTLPLFYNGTAWPYLIAYGAVTLAGNGLGALFYQKR